MQTTRAGWVGPAEPAHDLLEDRVGRPSLAEALALLSVASLFVRSDLLPTLFDAGALQIQVQDLLFLVLAVTVLKDRGMLIRPSALVVLAFVVLLPVGIAAIRSPVRAEALVSVAKLAEFASVGALVMVALREARRPWALTATFAVGALSNGIYGVAALLAIDKAAVFTSRTATLVGPETAATAAAAVVVWCLVRINYATWPAERQVATVGLIGAVLALFAAKSVLALAAVPAFIMVALLLERRCLPYVAVVAACALLSVAVGREPDLTSLGRSQTEVAKAPRPAPVERKSGEATAPPVADRRRSRDKGTDASKVGGGDVGGSGSRGADASRGPDASRGVPESADGPPAGRAAAPPDPDTTVGGSFVHRIALGYAGVQMFREAPWNGKGWLFSSQASTLADGPYDRRVLERFPNLDPQLFPSLFPTHVHNAYIQLAAEAGLGALVLFVALLATAIVVCVRRLTTPEGRHDWWTIVGLGWLCVLVVYFHGNVLFGGTFNTSLMGAGLGLAASVAQRLRFRHAAAVAALGTLIVVPAMAFIISGASADVPPTAMVSVSDTRTREEVFAVKHRFRDWSDSALSNGLVRLDGDGRTLRLTALDAAGRATGRPTALRTGDASRPGSVSLVRRGGNVTTVLYRLDSGAAITVSVVRGVPGVYVTPETDGGPATKIGAELGKTPSLFLRDRAQGFVGGPDDRTPWSTEAFQLSAALVPSGPSLLTVLPFYDAAVTNNVDGGGRGLFVEQRSHGRGTVFFGLSPVPGAAAYGRAPRTLLAGRYIAAHRRDDHWTTEERQVTQGQQPAWFSGADAVLPLEIDDPAVAGVDEVAGTAQQLRAFALTNPSAR